MFDNWALPWFFLLVAFWFLLVAMGQAPARPGQWAQATPERQAFFKQAMRPDYLPQRYPCCGEADAYEADDFTTDADGNLYAILTCNDPDTCEPPELDRYLAPGTKILIKPEKLLPPHQPDNLTGHGIVFVATNAKDVFCYALPGGV